VWLPDAMAGPTPVSALIHAATMVTAGVYLMCRVSPLLAEAPAAGTLIAIVGAATALFAATIAVAQNDIKRVLAYSTISQLGYMFLAVGSGAYTAAVFHMVTHAFFKALLFLGAGSVIHGMHDEQDMRYMGALRKLLPITSGTFIIAWLAIAGVPPFAGFWSKDDILLAAWDKSPILWLVGFVTALLTAYYMTRQVILVFFGKARWTEARPEGHEVHPHESPALMVAPLVVLAALATVAGALNLPFNHHTELLTRWLAPVVESAEHHLPSSTTDLRWPLAAAAVVVALIGIVVAWLVYERQRAKAIEPEVLAHAWYVDEGVSWFVGHPGRAAFEDTAWADKNVVDGAVNGTAGLIHLTAEKVRRIQSGYVRQYALGFAVGVVVLLAWFVSRGLV
jgi:NADH-quinone oxidoreductase subunit L